MAVIFFMHNASVMYRCYALYACQKHHVHRQTDNRKLSLNSPERKQTPTTAPLQKFSSCEQLNQPSEKNNKHPHTNCNLTNHISY